MALLGWGLAALSLAGCAATVPEVEHRKKLAEQREEYEREVFRVDQERKRLLDEIQDLNDRLAQERARSDSRAERYIAALSHKQRLIDDLERKLARSERFRRTPVSDEVKGEVTRAARGVDGEVAETKAGAVFVRVPVAQLFAEGSILLKEGALASMSQLAAALAPHADLRVEVWVHSDDAAPQGQTIEDSWSLTLRRAASVVRELERSGVDPSRLSASAYGRFRPRYAGERAAGGQNSRVEIWIRPLMETEPPP